MKKTCFSSGNWSISQWVFSIVSQVSVERLLRREYSPFEISCMSCRRVVATFSAVRRLAAISYEVQCRAPCGVWRHVLKIREPLMLLLSSEITLRKSRRATVARTWSLRELYEVVSREPLTAMRFGGLYAGCNL